jgi:hypothetical protein
LQVGQELSLNFSLQVGGVEQQVEVTGEVPIVQTTTAAVAAVVTQEQLRMLPLNGRSFVDLVTIQPGTMVPVSTQNRGPNYGTGTQLSVSGARTDANSFMIDGTDIQGTSNHAPGSASGGELGVDTIREFQVITSNPKAEYGRNAGGIINAVTRSGTNEWHGSAFEFLRNSVLDARTFFDQKQVPPFKRNQFGATFGGPMRRDQTFFFFGYEGLRQRLNESRVWRVPTAQGRLGIGILQPGEQVHPRVPPYINLFPLPNGAILGGGIGEFTEDTSQPTTENFGSGRIDHNFSPSDFLFGRYTISRGHAETIQNLRSNQFLETANQYLTVQEDHIFSATLLNMFRVGFNRSATNVLPTQVPGGEALGFVPHQPVGVFSAGGLASLGPNQTARLFQVQNAFQFEENLTYTRGPHTMKFGAMAERFRWNTDQPAFIQGSITFSDLRNFLLAGPVGTSATLLLPQSSTYRHVRTTLLGFFAQDDYRATPNLTLNLGFRWEFTTGFSETDNLMSYLRRGPLLSDNSDLITGELYANRIKNFEPRLGFNWALGKDQKTALSGGFGIFHNQILHNLMVSFRAQLPFYFRGTFPNLDATGTFPDIQAMIASVAQFRVTRHLDHDHFMTPTFYRYNLALQRELPGEMALRVAYIGALARHLTRRQGLNNFPAPIVQTDGSLFFPPSPAPQFINPNFAEMELMSSDVNSIYGALAATLQKRLTHGLIFQASYTYSKSIDDYSAQETNFIGIGANPQYAPDRTLERARSNFNVPHVLVSNWAYELPLGPGKRWLHSGGVGGMILGSWQIGGIVTLQQGVPFTVGSRAATRGFAFVATRPNLNPGVDVNQLTGGPRERYFDTSAFSVPPPGTIGNASRNLLLGPPLYTVNFSLRKSFPLGEQTQLQFRGEFFNLFNHTNFNYPTENVFTSPTGGVNPAAGRISSTTTTGRQIQFALKLMF